MRKTPRLKPFLWITTGNLILLLGVGVIGGYELFGQLAWQITTVALVLGMAGAFVLELRFRSQARWKAVLNSYAEREIARHEVAQREMARRLSRSVRSGRR